MFPCNPQCYGFVTFATREDAEQVLAFAQQQGVVAEDRMLRINWASSSMPEWKVRRKTRGGRRQRRRGEVAEL